MSSLDLQVKSVIGEDFAIYSNEYIPINTSYIRKLFLFYIQDRSSLLCDEK